jgi:hypothetical protein
MAIQHGAARFDGQGGMDVDAIVIRLSELPQALREKRSDIIVSSAEWPIALSVLFFFLCVLIVTALQGIIAREGIKHGYNVERCDKITVKGIEYADCVRLTKPNNK